MIKLVVEMLLSLLIYSLMFMEVEPIPGGWTQQNVTNNRAVENAAQYAVNMYNHGSNSIYFKKLVTIKSARTQVVAGIKYVITFDIGETECKKNANELTENNGKECQLVESIRLETCTATIWQKPWLNETSLLDLKCS